VKPFANAGVTIESPWCLSVVVCGVEITHPFYSMDADVPAVVEIDLLTVAKLVIDAKNRCVYSHHHACLEVEPATFVHEPILRVENASNFTLPPPTASTSTSAQTDLACVATDLRGISSPGVGAPSPPPPTDAPKRPAPPHSPAPLPSPPLATSAPCDVVGSSLDPQAFPYQPTCMPLLTPPTPHRSLLLRLRTTVLVFRKLLLVLSAPLMLLRMFCSTSLRHTLIRLVSFRLLLRLLRLRLLNRHMYLTQTIRSSRL